MVFAAWNLAFHRIALTHLYPCFADYQLLLPCREWLQHADGRSPASVSTGSVF